MDSGLRRNDDEVLE